MNIIQFIVSNKMVKHNFKSLNRVNLVRHFEKCIDYFFNIY